MQTVIVICGGWSVKQYDVFDLRERGHVIGVNESAVLFKCDTGLTMDRLWAEHRYQRFLDNRSGDLWVRRAAAKNLPEHPRIRVFDCDHHLSHPSTEEGVFNGTNSGAVALNLAYQMKPLSVFVFGLDMQRGPNQEPYHHPPYEWANPEGATKPGKYKEWVHEFRTIKHYYDTRRINLVQVNHRSAVRSIPSISYDEFLKRTSHGH